MNSAVRAVQASARPTARARPQSQAARPVLDLQYKPLVGLLEDPFEHEADRIADAVISGGIVPAVSIASSEGPQRKCSACEEAEREGGAAGTAVDAVASGGRPMPPALRAYFEPRFGRDLSDVRIHDDARAGAAARAIKARAYALGRNIAFATGEYAPGSRVGRRLIAHELAHVVQQAGSPMAPRLMRATYPGCDKRTTGVDDANARIDAARAEASRIMAVASGAFPRMSQHTIRLVNRHFHCPSTSQILTIMKTLAAIEAAVPSLYVRCVRPSADRCGGPYTTGYAISDGGFEVCPYGFKEEFKQELGGIAGNLIWAAARNMGLNPGCGWLTPCYNDFTVPASDMVQRVGAYLHFALDLAGYPHREPPTIPCSPRRTGLYVSVPPGAVNPRQIRPVTGYDPPPSPGSRISDVYEDQAGNKFIYMDRPEAEVYMYDEPQVYLPNEPKRLYLSPNVWAVRDLPPEPEERPPKRRRRR